MAALDIARFVIRFCYWQVQLDGSTTGFIHLILAIASYQKCYYSLAHNDNLYFVTLLKLQLLANRFDDNLPLSRQYIYLIKEVV